MAEWFSIEVLDGPSSARSWKEAFGDPLIAAGYGLGLTGWEWHEFRWGVVLEVELPDDFAWEQLRDHPTVRAALDAVPDPVSGLLLHRGAAAAPVHASRGDHGRSPAPARRRCPSRSKRTNPSLCRWSSASAELVAMLDRAAAVWSAAVGKGSRGSRSETGTVPQP